MTCVSQVKVRARAKGRGRGRGSRTCVIVSRGAE